MARCSGVSALEFENEDNLVDLTGQRVKQPPLLYPVRADGDYTLIVDGTAVVESREGRHRVLITPTKAVLHRPAAAPDPASPCGADCVPLLPPTDRDGS